ncbi:hypothetical protein [Rubrimonas sp.]|uniref:hypothetical protein n=1 Tax=Rubrimonas sp. TaxID=2036015 RepID=UPI002FDD2D1E
MNTSVNACFTDQRILMDGKTFMRCRFERCELVFAGVGAVNFSENALWDCRFSFEGPAGRALGVFAAVVNMMPPERREDFVRAVLDAHLPKQSEGGCASKKFGSAGR